MHPILLPISAAILLAATPVAAEVTYRIDSRFGVGYASDPNNPQGSLQPLYEGRFTTTFAHQADNGMRFRFEIGVVVGNIETERGGAPYGIPAGAGAGERPRR